MGYSTPPTAVPGASLAAATWNSGVRDSLIAAAKPPRCRMRRTTNLSVANATPTAVPLDTADVDTDSIWVSGTPSRLIAPVDGLYLAGGGGQFAVNATGARMVYLQKSGGTILAMFHGIGNGTWYVGGAVNTPVVMSAGDYIEMYVYQTSGGALNLDTTVSGYPIWASLVLASY